MHPYPPTGGNKPNKQTVTHLRREESKAPVGEDQ